VAGDRQRDYCRYCHYTYIAQAPEGGVSLENYTNVRAWFQRVERLAGFVAKQAAALGLAA
jgi:glutathione S-transferase